MAYLSSDQITGKVLVNLHSDGLAIYNNTSIKRNINIEKSQIYSAGKPATDITKFSKGSISEGSGIPIGEDLSGDFTFSMWGYATNTSLFGINSFNTTATNDYYIIAFARRDQTSIICMIGTDHSDENTTHSKTITNYAWHHYAICHSNNMLYYFIDGELIRSEDISDPKYKNFITNHGKFKMYTQTDNCISWNSSSSGTAYMDDIVVIKDQCLWTKKFTTPTDVLVGNSLKYTQVLYPYPSVNEKDRLKLY